MKNNLQEGSLIPKEDRLVPKLNSTFDNTFEGMKVGMGVTHDLMSRYPAYKPIALVNDAFDYAINFYSNNDRHLDNQFKCLHEMMRLTGLDDITCVKIQKRIFVNI